MKTKSIKSFNDWLALKITNGVSTMWCAYLFTILSLTGLPSAIQQSISTNSPLPIVGWTAQTFLQLVLLCIILVGQKLQSEKSDRHIDRMLKHISQDNDRILEELNKRRK